MANIAGPAPTHYAPPRAEDRVSPTFTAPSFYITERQPLNRGAILLAIVAAVVALCLVMYALGHGGGAQGKNDDDPDEVDTIVLGDPSDAPVPAHPGDHVSPVHPTILVRLPRFGDQVGLIPDTAAGHLLYNWLGAFNRASSPALANALPSVALASVTAAQLELRQQTGGFSLLSAKEAMPGVVVFRLRDQTPAANEVLGTLQVRPRSNPATIASFSLRAVPAPSGGPARGIQPHTLP